MKKNLLIVFAIACFSCVLNAGIVTLDASAEGLWKNHSLVYALVKSVKRIDNSDQYKIKVHPVATLTGKFDCGISDDDLELDIDACVFTSAISMSPDLGPESRVLILIKEGDREKQKKYSVPPSVFTFMPSRGGALKKVSGIDDKIVAEVMDKIRKARIPSTNQNPNKPDAGHSK